MGKHQSVKRNALGKKNLRKTAKKSSVLKKYSYQHGGTSGRCGWQSKGPVAAAQVGTALNYSDLDTLPGTAGKPGESNHYPYNTEVVEPPSSTSNTPPKVMSGGRRSRRKKHRGRKSQRRRCRAKRGGVGSKCGKKNTVKKRNYGHQKGGSGGLIRSRLFPTELVNFTRSVLHSPRKFINTWGGYEQPANLDFNPAHQPINKVKMPQLRVGARISEGETKTAVKESAKLY